MTFLIETLYELIWNTGVYYIFYKLFNKILTKNIDVFQILFNIEIRLIHFQQECDFKLKHSTLHFLSSVSTFFLMCLRPIVNTIIYWLFFSFIDIAQVNSIILLIYWLQILKLWDGYFFTANWILIGQLFYTIINFRNSEMLLPAIFQIIDEIYEIQVLIEYSIKIFNNLMIKNMEDNFLFDSIIFLQKNKRQITISRLTILGLIGAYSIFFTDLYMTSEIFFYYYVAVRIVQIYITLK